MIERIPPHITAMLEQLGFVYYPDLELWASTHEENWAVMFKLPKNTPLGADIVVHLKYGSDTHIGRNLIASTSSAHYFIRNKLLQNGYPVEAIERIRKLNLLLE